MRDQEGNLLKAGDEVTVVLRGRVVDVWSRRTIVGVELRGEGKGSRSRARLDVRPAALMLRVEAS